MCPEYTDAPALWILPILLFPLAPPRSPTPGMIQFPNPGLCINYFVCDHYTRLPTFLKQLSFLLWYSIDEVLSSEDKLIVTSLIVYIVSPI